MSSVPTLPGNNRQEGEVSTITPSVSLIPIKQEQGDEPSRKNSSNNVQNGETETGHFQPATSLSSLIKISPLKSLLRDEFKRKINTPESSQPHNSESNLWRFMTYKETLQCSFCGITFPDQTLYFLHKGCHSETNPWKCNICGEQCNNVYEFNSHLLSKNHQ